MINSMQVFWKPNWKFSLFWYVVRKGDYCRYKAEFSEGLEKEEAADKSLEAYTKASEAAESLQPTDPTRLGLSLNFSVFYYEIKNDSSKACEVAKEVWIWSCKKGVGGGGGGWVDKLLNN